MRKLRLALAFVATLVAGIVAIAPAAHADVLDDLTPSTNALCLKCLIGSGGSGGGL